MTTRITDYLYIALTIIFTVYGQLILKWRMNFLGQLPLTLLEKSKFMAIALLDPWILSCFTAAFLASLSWMAAMTKFELVQVYPLMSLNFVLVFLLAGTILNEPMTLYRILGLLFIVIGVVLLTRS